MLSELPQRSTGAEIGVATGKFSQQILTIVDPRTLHLVDLDFSRLSPKVRDDERTVLHCADSATCLSGFADASLDWAYVDGDHTFDGVARDADTVAKKLKPGGIVIFNDFAHLDPHLGQYGVHRAVSEFVVERNWPVVMFAFEPNGLYDIAIQKPEDSETPSKETQ